MSVRPTTLIILLGSVAGGGALGLGSALTDAPVGVSLDETARAIPVAAALRRAREPRPGDRWGGCDDARAAGTAPIYRGEPGYRDDMDGDGDGVACEPRRG